MLSKAGTHRQDQAAVAAVARAVFSTRITRSKREDQQFTLRSADMEAEEGIEDEDDDEGFEAEELADTSGSGSSSDEEEEGEEEEEEGKGEDLPRPPGPGETPNGLL